MTQTATTETLLTEIASSIRMLMRDAMTRPQGGGVPPGEFFTQMRRLDRAMGKPPHQKEGKWEPPTKTAHGHVDTEQAFSKPLPIDPKAEPPKNGKAKKAKDPVLVQDADGKWVLKK